MANLTKLNWPGGWTPSEDPINGSPEGLLRADNLQQDEDGVLSLIRGMKQLGTAFSDYVSDGYAKYFGANEAVYVGLNANGHTVQRSLSGNFDDTTTLIASGSNRACFGDALGRVLVCAGGQRIKDNSIQEQALGLQTAGTPTITAISQPCMAFGGAVPTYGNVTNTVGGTASLIVGTMFGAIPNGHNLIVDTSVLSAIWWNVFGATDTTNIDTGQADDIGLDLIQFYVVSDDPSSVTEYSLTFILDSDTSSPQNVFNYYKYTWGADQLLQGPQQQSSLIAYRKDFTRHGTDATLDWRHVTAVVFECSTISVQTVGMSGLAIYGGATGQINGTYQYVQVNVNNTGLYLAKSPASDPTSAIVVSNGNVQVTTGTVDDQTTEVWIFRISTVPPTGPDTSFLDKYYRVGVVQPGSTFTDNMSDVEAIEIDITANLFLRSLQSTDTNGIPEDIIGMEGLYNGFMLYLSRQSLYISDSLNPDAVDSRFTIKAFGDPNEQNLWIHKISNNVLILGTSKNNYEISGTLTQLPDGTLDANIIPIGEAYPSLCSDSALVNGGIFYIASDGIRVTLGSTSTLISPQLRLLWQGSTRSGIPAVAIIPNNNARYSIAAGKTKLYITVPMVDGTRRLLVYDLVKQNYFLRYTDPEIVFTTPSDRVLLGYNVSTNPNTGLGKLFQLDTGEGLTDNSGNDIQGFACTLLTVFDHNKQPRNRKDTFTLKLVADTGGEPLNVMLAYDNGPFAQLGTISSNTLTTFFFPLDKYTLGFRYALQITDVNLVHSFKLYEYTIEYEARPEQVNYMRLLPTNMGSYARKRWTSFAYVIDTLGNSISFQPYVDNAVSGPADVVVTLTKLTHITFFTDETIGTDMGGIFSGGVFEFYTVNLEETVSEKLPTPCEFLVIPANNYGAPNRKRHTSYKFQINTRGADVSFTPLLDNTPYGTRIVNTARKTTVEYFFAQSDGDVIGIDIGGTLASVGHVPFEFYGTVVPQQVEQLPDRLKYFVIPANNYGVPNRKRHSSFKFQINTNNGTVAFSPIIDGFEQVPLIFQTAGKQTVEYFFHADTIGIDIGGILNSLEDTPFEFYGVVVPQEVEQLPARLEFFLVPPNNYGTPNRKRFSSFKFQINTNGSPVLFTPIVDGVEQPSATFTTPGKATVEYYFQVDTIGIDIGGILSASTPFEFYGVLVPQQVEQLPDQLEFFLIPPNDYGTPNRKRHSSYKFQINTNSKNVNFTPIIDGVSYPVLVVNTAAKKTVEYFFPSDTIGIDIGGTLHSQSDPFEFYGVLVPQQVEPLPDRLEFFLIPPNNYGIPNRKRHSSYKFQINTNGMPCIFTPIIDMVAQLPLTFVTASKETVEYFFHSDTIGIEIGGTLVSSYAFEFYGVIIPQKVEQLPDRLEFFLIPPNDYGVPNRKRHSSYKFQINTNGLPCTFTPIIDGIPYTGLIFNTTNKATVEYFFDVDTIGIDIGGTLSAASPFEFYGVVIPQTVEKLPDRLQFFLIPPSDYGVPNRKRHSSYKFQINTNGAPCIFTPIIDMVAQAPLTFVTVSKEIVEYFFHSDTIGIEIGGTLVSSFAFEFYGTIVPQQVEQLPDRLEFFLIPPNNYGVPNRKRHSSYKFQINTNGMPCTFTPIIDGVIYTPLVFATPSKSTVEYFFDIDTVGIDIGGTLQSSTPFEFYGVVVPQTVEKLPDRLQFYLIPPNDYGVPNRKRHSSYKFQINTNGQPCTFTPIIDMIPQEPLTFVTASKEIVEYFFHADTIGIEIGGTLSATTPFEFYGTITPQQIEQLPDRLEFFLIPPNDYGVPNRKRHSSYKFQINTNGQACVFTPIIDGIQYVSSVFNTPSKATVEHFFDADTIGIDIGGTLNCATPFEFYGVVVPQTVEKLPDRLRFFLIPPNDYGVPNRKRHSSYKFQINTNGQNVLFTPILDGTLYTPLVINTPSKKTVEYFFLDDTIAIDIGGTLHSQTASAFEFYGVVVPQTVEKLPDRLEYYRIPNNNFEIASRKRVRTIPIVIDTYGSNVIFTPIVDGVLQLTTTTLNSLGKTTLYHFFVNDVFGTDFGGQLRSASVPPVPFEFYELGENADVETLPVPKKYDQLGPVRYDKIGKIFTLRVRLIMNGLTTVMPFSIFGDDQVSNPTYDSNPLYVSSFNVVPQVDGVYEIILPKNINSDVFRLTLGPTIDSFHRYDVQIRVSSSGMETDAKWVPIR